jgi:hypothetical protein
MKTRPWLAHARHGHTTAVIQAETGRLSFRRDE